MIDIKNKLYKPSLDELTSFVGNRLFNEHCKYLADEYKAVCKIEYSGDNVLLGWNVKFKKSGRTLCTLYPRAGHFKMLLVVGPKEKERVEAILQGLSTDFQSVYNATKEGMGQRWLIFDFAKRNELYNDVLKIIRFRRESK